MGSAKHTLLKPATVASYFDAEKEACLEALNAYAKSKSNEHLHQLRVAIKKIRAVARMLAKLDPKFDCQSALLPFIKAFKLAAPVREELLFKEELDALQNISAGQKKMFSAKLNTYQDMLVKDIPLLEKQVKAKSSVVRVSAKKVKKKEVVHYTRHQLKRLKPQWKDAVEQDNIHGFRKRIKNLLYTVEILSPHQQKRVVKASVSKQLLKLQNLLGAWHDKDLFIAQVKKRSLNIGHEKLTELIHQNDSMKRAIISKGNKLWK